MSETYPPESDGGDGTPLPFAGEPPKNDKPRVSLGWWLLGFATPWLTSFAIGYALTAAAEPLSNHPRILNYSAPLLGIIVFAVIVVAFVWGRHTGDNRLRSFGLGGLISYAVSVLFGLLAFGACMVIFSGFNPSAN